MPYEKELAFLSRMFAKCRLQLLCVDSQTLSQQPIDCGLRSIFDGTASIDTILADAIRAAKDRTIYRLTDSFLCSYLFCRMPDQDADRIVIVGPYLSMELDHNQLMEQCEQCKLDPACFPLIERYYAALPVISGDSVLLAAIDSLAEIFWGSDGFTMVDLNRDSPFFASAPIHAELDMPSEELKWKAAAMEQRYAYENELMQAVSLGQTNKAELMLSGFSKMSFERRHADPVRNLKNYCIIMNTLLRKAAERGGVHPLYLDRLSSDFARRIEALTTTEAVGMLMNELFRGYCRLVRKNATSQYTPPIERTILYIDLNISGDLSLTRLAEEQSINASYLSSLFKKETGRTLTDFINERRVHAAARLLRNTKLQIQTVAQHCGIADVNYFSKIFKKYTGKTPGEYRKEQI